MIASTSDIRPRIPDDIAQIVISPKSYADDAVIYGAFNWLRENMPSGVAQVPGFDAIWIVTNHADIQEVERNGKLCHNAQHNPILNDQPSDAFTRDINDRSLGIISSLTFMDPPEHAAYRSLTSNWFFPAKSASWRNRSGRWRRSRSSICSASTANVISCATSRCITLFASS
jgi:cytochrome P450